MDQLMKFGIFLQFITAIFLALCVTSTHASPVILKDIAYGSAPLQKLDIYKPANATKGNLLPVHVFIHGGAWRAGDKDQHRAMGNFYAERGAVLVTINYRLFPKDPHPAQIEDVATAVKWLYDHIGEYGGDRTRLVLSGHSAGAHLAALLAADPQYLTKHHLRTDLLRAVVPVDTASFDFTSRADGGPVVRAVNRTIKRNFGPDDVQLRAASPIYQAPRNGHLPEFYLFVTSQRADAVKQTKDFADVLDRAGAPASEVKIIEGLSHSEMARAISDANSPIAQRILRLLKTGKASLQIREAVSPTKGKAPSKEEKAPLQTKNPASNKNQSSDKKPIPK